MDQVALLAELRAVANNVPNFDAFTATSRVHHEWLGKVSALMGLWNDREAGSVRTSITMIGYEVAREMGIAGVMTNLHRAIADLELRLPRTAADHVFGPGAVYDFFKTLRDLLASATQSILIVDPYLDDKIFDAYLSAVAQGVTVRLLTRHVEASFEPAVVKFVAQKKMNVEPRRSDRIHDRVIFLDGRSCWVLGQSIKDAAKSRVTYLAPLEDETVQLKREFYEQIWAIATPLTAAI
jgi:hypothetical protein